jgi:glycosyltransferase involved in cell wall biosynthesis
MRVLFANDGYHDAGGVQSYLSAVMAGLAARGHEIGLVHLSPYRPEAPAPSGVRLFGAGELGRERLLDEVRRWGPDVVYSHNMAVLDLEGQLLDRWPVVKFMHGYFGTCVSGQKMCAFPGRAPCARRFGPACLTLYLPRRCGSFNVGTMIAQYRWARAQNALFPRYTAVVVASAHMRAEYLTNGVPPERLHVNPLFPGDVTGAGEAPAAPPAHPRVTFLGRMTKLKGGDLLVRAAGRAGRQLGQPVEVVMVGDGPQRGRWEGLARRLGVPATFTGWLDGAARVAALRAAGLLAVPSVWPEPFGLVGLEANCCGVPAIAFDVGGVREWLTDGVNGFLVRRPTARALADGLVRAFEDPGRLAAMGEPARAAARALSVAAHLDRLERLFAAVLGRHLLLPSPEAVAASPAGPAPPT